MRLQKYMAHAGVASRRKCEEIIAEGRVAVNGTTIDTQGYQVEPGDTVTVDGKKIRPVRHYTYILLNKPRGVVSTAKDNKGRKTVLDVVSRDFRGKRLYPVGRLDMDSSGLLLLTDDGELTEKLLHPRYEMEKTYRVTVKGRVDKESVQNLSRGIELDDGPTAPASFKILDYRNDKTRLECKIHEGRNRQIRRMFEKEGHEVVQLERVAFGPLKLGDLGKGQYRPLRDKEIRMLKSWK
ncbi:MAG: pseudouridine synthase [Firmicutes bacterium]|nr:pseudouridine synthase [Bacillota bacterium]